MVQGHIHRLQVLAPAAAICSAAAISPATSDRAATAASGSRSSAAEPTGRAVDARVVITMHGDQPVPFVLGPAFAEHAADRMASAAELVGILIAGVGEVDQTPFCVEHDRPGFFGSQAVRVGERFDDATRDFRRDLHVVERHHPANRQLPVFGRGAPIRDASHPLLVVGNVTTAARLYDVRVRHRNAFVGRGSGATCRPLRDGRLRRLLGRRQERQDRHQRDHANEPAMEIPHMPLTHELGHLVIWSFGHLVISSFRQ